METAQSGRRSQRQTCQTYQAEPAAPIGTDWQWRGRCRDADPDLFSRPDGRSSRAAAERTRRAKAVCVPCEVWRPCLKAALLGRDTGVWGGLDDVDRAALLARVAGDVDRALDLAAHGRRGTSA